MSKINNFIHRQPSEKSCNRVQKFSIPEMRGNILSHAGKVIAFSMHRENYPPLYFSLREYFTEASRTYCRCLCGKSMPNIFYFLQRKIICFLGLKS